MAKYVDIESSGELAEAMYNLLRECQLNYKVGCFADDCYECIRRFLSPYGCGHLFPTADVQEAKHGKWSDTMVCQVDPIFGDSHFGFKCSECGEVLNKTPYCGNCGAKMDGQRGCHDEDGCTNGCIVPHIYRRLAQYEDIGLTPEEIKALQADNERHDKNRRLVEHCYRTTTTMLNPIVDWTDSDVWDFLKHYGMAGKHRYTEFRLYPKYHQNYIKAFERMIAHRNEKGLENKWKNGKEVMKWWLGEDPDQIMLWDEEF